MNNPAVVPGFGVPAFLRLSFMLALSLLVACAGQVKQEAKVVAQAKQEKPSECYVEVAPLQTPAVVGNTAAVAKANSPQAAAESAAAPAAVGEPTVAAEQGTSSADSQEATARTEQTAVTAAQSPTVAANTTAKADDSANTVVVAGQSPGTEKKPAGKLICPPKGFIELTEDYTVDPEVQTEFDQAMALLAEAKYEEAIRLLKAVTAKAKKFTGPFVNLGIAYVRSGEYKLAEKALDKALKLNKTHPVANNELAMVYRKTGRYQEARTLYLELLAVYPEFLPARRNLGVLCDIYLQDPACAVEQFEIYMQEVPNDEQMKIWLAEVKARS